MISSIIKAVTVIKPSFMFFLLDVIFFKKSQIPFPYFTTKIEDKITSLVDKKVFNVDTIFINNLTKKIYDTDFFSDVKISYNQDILTITVSENSVVNFFYINGIKDDDLDKVNKMISLKENSIFSSSKLKKDIETIKDYFKSGGYFRVSVEPEVIKIPNNQINLILNIDKKEVNAHAVKSSISSAKNELISSEEYSTYAQSYFQSIVSCRKKACPLGC